MKDTARITLNLTEATALKVALRGRMRRIDRLVEIDGDPSGVQAEDRAVVESLYNRVDAAIERILSLTT